MRVMVTSTEDRPHLSRRPVSKMLHRLDRVLQDSLLLLEDSGTAQY